MAIVYRSADFKDIPALVKVHMRCFPDYFLTSLGYRLLIAFYTEYMQEAQELFVLAEEDSSVIGFVMGHYSGASARSRFERKNKKALTLRILVLCLRGNKEALCRAIVKFTSIFKKKSALIVTPVNPDKASLLSIGVLPEYRGQSVAQEMVTRFEDILRSKRKHFYTLSVRNENERAVSFYYKLGMKVLRQTDGETVFTKDI